MGLKARVHGTKSKSLFFGLVDGPVVPPKPERKNILKLKKDFQFLIKHFN